MAVAEWVAGLDADAVCEAVRVRHVALLETEAEQFYLAAHWADLHPGETVEDDRRTRRRRSGGRVLPGTERGVRLGADGTPLVAEFAPAELGALQGLGHLAAARLIGDALTVRHRHPLLWLALAEGRVRVWQARKAAQLCADAGLDQTQARWVDEQTTPYLGLLPWGRFQTLLHARIIEADPAAAEERRRAAALARFVRTGQSTEHGIKTLVARAAAGDVIFFVAMVDRIAQVLCENGDTDPADVLRSKAIGILATPARALALLHASTAAHTALENDPDLGRPGDVAEELDHTLHAGATDETGAEVEDPDKVGETVVHPSQNDAPDPAGEPGPQTGPCPACAGTGQATGDPTAFVKQPVHPKQLLPNATLYIHISSAMLPAGPGPAAPDSDPAGARVARFEGVGPITRQQVVEFLGHTNVRVVPVLDLAGQEPVDGYEVPDRMAEALRLRSPACVFPWATNLSRRKDKDHNQPYLPPQRGGPPGQTRLDNLAGLTRFAHRLKTHGRWRLCQTGPGVWHWRSPHGYWYRIDHTGTEFQGHTDEVEAIEEVPDAALSAPANAHVLSSRCSRRQQAQ